MIDEFDAEIIKVLQTAGRISWLQLAEQVNLSASAAQRRVQAMEKSGVIKNFSVVIDEKLVGNEIKAIVMVNVARQNGKAIDNFRKRINQYPQVQSMQMLSGTVDFMLEVVAPDIDSFAQFMEQKILTLSGVKDASSSIVLGTAKQHCSMVA